MIEFMYNNVKNISTSHILLELNFGYHAHMSFKEDISPCFPTKITNKLAAELSELLAFAVKISITRKDFRSKLTIKPLSFKAMYPMIKFG